MQSHKNLFADTSYLKPQPRDERMRIPGSQSSQARIKHSVNVIPCKPSPCSRLVSDSSQTIPRTLNFRSRTPSNGSRHRTSHAAYTTRKSSTDDSSPNPESQSFGILDFYTQDSSTSTPADLTPRSHPVVQTYQASIAAFDFGLDAKQIDADTKPRRPILVVKTQIEPSKPSLNISPGTPKSQKSGRSNPSSSTRRPSIQSLSKPLPSTPIESNYTLFPKESLTPIILKTNNDTLPPTPTSINTTVPLPPLDTTLPTRPRKASLASMRSRSDSLSTLLPALSFSHQRRKPSISTQHTSLTSSPASRWSGDTATSEGRHSGAEEAQSPQWPQSFFEDDDDEEDVPLRRKVVERFRRGGVRETSGEWRNGNVWGKERGWRSVGCGCLGRKK